MTAVQIIPLAILVAMFVVATKWPLNIGVMGLVASFGVGYFLLGLSDRQILADFPASIVLTIIGVTYFFSMAQRNGTIGIIVKGCVRMVRGKTLLLPWVFFLAAVLAYSDGFDVLAGDGEVAFRVRGTGGPPQR